MDVARTSHPPHPKKRTAPRAPGGDPKAPYFALLTQGFPRLTTVSADGLQRDDVADLPEVELAQVRLRDDQAVIPDLARVESMVFEALQQAA